MAQKKKKAKAARARKPSRKAAKVQTSVPGPGETRFLNDLRVRGEVAKLTPQGKLPLPATHIETENEDGSTTIRRARYKLF